MDTRDNGRQQGSILPLKWIRESFCPELDLLCHDTLHFFSVCLPARPVALSEVCAHCAAEHALVVPLEADGIGALKPVATQMPKLGLADHRAVVADEQVCDGELATD